MRGAHLGVKYEIKSVGAYWQVSIDGNVRTDHPSFVMFPSAYDWVISTIEVMVKETK
jgi:hypothetical protein